MSPKVIAEQFLHVASSADSSSYCGMAGELAQAYLDLEKRMQAAMKIVEMAKNYRSCGAIEDPDCEFADALEEFESANG